MNYFRITAYDSNNNFSFIIDSNGKFEKLWQFSSYLISKGFKVLEVSSAEKFIDVNIEKVNVDSEHFFLRAIADGEPKTIEQIINGIKYKAIQIDNKIYIPSI